MIIIQAFNSFKSSVFLNEFVHLLANYQSIEYSAGFLNLLRVEKLWFAQNKQISSSSSNISNVS
jgi:hypothetical protein